MNYHQPTIFHIATWAMLLCYISLLNGDMSNCDRKKLQLLLNKTNPCEMELECYVNVTLHNYIHFCNETPGTVYTSDECLSYNPADDTQLYVVESDHYSQTGSAGNNDFSGISSDNCRYRSGISGQALTQFTCNFKRYREECYKMLEATRKDFSKYESYCPGEFDKLICWPHAKNDSLISVPCPNYMKENYTATNGSSYRYCNGNGTWYMREVDGSLKPWRYLENCNPLVDVEVLEEDYKPRSTLKTITIIYHVGYAISLTFLVGALVIFIVFKKLRCVRNYIHMNLMLSFILRYVMALLYNYVVAKFYTVNIEQHPSDDTCDEYLSSAVFTNCRCVAAVWHYFIISNFYWLLVEGIHLLLLLTKPLKSSKSRKYFPWYMALGWGFPLIPTLIWVVLKIMLENVDCWEKFGELHLKWAIDVFVILTIVINFFIFIYVISVILSKLRSKNRNQNDFKTSLAWSTLALMPLLGIHYIVFLIVPADAFGSKTEAKTAQVAFELVTTSFQGFLVALFYCFLNAEVQGEVKKRWKKYQALKKLSSTAPRKISANNANYTQATSLNSSVQPEEKLLLSKNATAVAQV